LCRPALQKSWHEGQQMQQQLDTAPELDQQQQQQQQQQPVY
jgi:hypothetical protein